MRPYCPAGSQPAERYKGRRRGTRGSRFEASHHGEGPRPQRPTESGAVGQPVSRRAERWRSRRDPAGRCRSHSRRLTRAAPRWQRSRLPPCPPQPGPARPSGGGARPARTAPARDRRPGAVLPHSAHPAGAAVGNCWGAVPVPSFSGAGGVCYTRLWSLPRRQPHISLVLQLPDVVS